MSLRTRVTTGLCCLAGLTFMTSPIWFSDMVHGKANASQSVFPLDRLAERNEKCPAGYYALTFDDGPHPGDTERLVQRLKEVKAVATFFNMGSHAMAHPELVKLQQTVGQVQGHSWEHDDYTMLKPEEVRADIQQSLKYLPRPAEFMRPPFGASNAEVRKVIRDLGLTEAMWTVDTKDWEEPHDPKKVLNAAVTVKDGGIILLHDGWPYVAEVVPEIVSELDSRGMCPGVLERTKTKQLMPGDTEDYPFYVKAVKP